jgi:nitrite reductase (NO-forming)
MRNVMARARPILNAGGLVLALSLVSSQALAGDVRTVEVTAEEFAFKPATVEVEPGATVRLKLVNEGNMSHNLHLRDRDTKTDTIQAGKSDTLEFTAPRDGEVAFFCAIPGHESAGMKGKIVVQ